MKRAFDVAATLAGVVVLAPLFLAIAAAVALDSGRPVLFRQPRVGRYGRLFLIYKFRTMTTGAERRGPSITASSDSRMTRVGRILRRFKLDELPQLINVLKGDMSLVGPRPEVQRYVELFRREYEEILQVRPGITDLASIRFRNESDLLARADNPEHLYVTTILPAKIELARDYMRRSSLALDLRIIASTLVGGNA